MNRTLGRRGAVAATGLALLLSACFEDPGTIAGEVSGKNQFRYVCDDSAAVGNCSGTASIFPTAVARGALFRLSIDSSSIGDVDELEPISDDVVGTDASGAWVSNTDGLAGLVAFDRSGNVVDYVHVRIETPIRLTIESNGPSRGGSVDRASGTPAATVSVDAGEKVFLSAKPYGKTATALAGAITYSWVPAVEGVARVTSLGTPTAPSAFVTVEGVKAGTTRLRVEGAGLSSEIEVTVR